MNLIATINALKIETFGTAGLIKRNVPGGGSGAGTFYDLSVGSTACGTSHSNSDMIVALPSASFGVTANPNLSPSCSQCIRVTGPKGSVLAQVKDVCGGCVPGDVDMSPAAYAVTIGDESIGRTGVSWVRADCGGGSPPVVAAAVADVGVADSGVADSGVVGSGVADSGVADSGVADSGVPAPSPTEESAPSEVVYSTPTEDSTPSEVVYSGNDDELVTGPSGTISSPEEATTSAECAYTEELDDDQSQTTNHLTKRTFFSFIASLF